ncbi:hypothetical protein NMS_1026 [Nonlabens marinus S1-08]|uniref:Uncharacterized protein n=2 Tax=Nonlabens TaxID=363408 RepID=W8VQE6_9FLAO|nr:hypothetical protein NMS_1026 [Nonlabens marinus S1-08]
MTFIALVVVNSCGEKEESNSYEVAYVTAVDAPTSVKVNEPVNINVSFEVRNGCGMFEKFEETKDGQLITLEVKASYKDGMCTQAIKTITADYTFTPREKGDYQIRFKSSPTAFKTVDLPVD